MRNLPFSQRVKARLSLRSEAGLALLDVLLGIALFAIIAAVGFLVAPKLFGNAQEASTQNDVNAVSTALTSYYGESQVYPASLSSTASELDSVRLSNNNRVVYATNASRQRYTVCVRNGAGAYSVWDSDESKITRTGKNVVADAPAECGS